MTLIGVLQHGGECDAAQFGGSPSVYIDGTCRCIVCPRCGHHTGNSHQGHYWRTCKVLAARLRESLAPGSTMSPAEFLNRTSREFHFCCPDPAYGCEKEKRIMSFGFSAIGTSDEVITQLEAAPLGLGENRFNQFGADLRDLLVKHFGHEPEHARPYAEGHEFRYVVKANGHGGGSVPLSVQLTVEYQHVPVPHRGEDDGSA